MGGARPRLALLAIAVGLAAVVGRAEAACMKHVAGAPLTPIAWSLAQVEAPGVAIHYIGHSTFLLETPAGARIATDYNDFTRASMTPHIVTMNIAHNTHYSQRIERGVEHALEGWGTPRRAAQHELWFRDVFVRNVPTNIRDEGGATAYNANSIFIFETAGLCIAHLGHLHHVLREEHLARLGQVDILFVPVDGTWTMDQNAMMQVIEQIKAPVIIPMHFFSDASLLRFIAKVMDARHLGYEVVHSRVPQVTLSRESLPAGRQLLVLPGRM